MNKNQFTTFLLTFLSVCWWIVMLMTMMMMTTNFRSSHRGCFVRKNVLWNFAKFTGIYLCQSLFFNKVVGLRPATLGLAQVLFFEFCEISNNTFFTEHLWTTALWICSVVSVWLQNWKPIELFYTWCKSDSWLFHK